MKGDHFEPNNSASLNVVGEHPEPVVINPLMDELQLLEEHQTLLDIAKGSAHKDLVSSITLNIQYALKVINT